MNENLTLKPVAHIRTDFNEKFGVPRQSGIVDSVVGTIVFQKEFRDGQAIRDIEVFSHLWLLWGFSENEQRWSHTVRPPKIGGNKRVGVFASRSPFRPNPIGLSSVKILSVSYDKNYGPVIFVSGADMVDGTPIYDIKPYLPYTDCHIDASGGFSVDKKDAMTDVIFAEGTKDLLPLDVEKIIVDLLSQDPHPSYKKDENRIYNLSYGKFDVKFMHRENSIIICKIISK